MKRFSFFIALIGLIFSSVLHADEPSVDQFVPSAEKVGEARLRYLLLDIYDATLFAPNGTYKPDQPFALTLEYLRKLDGDAIAKRTIKEIKGQGFDDQAALDSWFEQIVKIFPDVQKGSKLTGILDDKRITRFYFDGKEVGTVNDPEFGTRFFDIWLGEKSSEAKMRDLLVGKKP